MTILVGTTGGASANKNYPQGRTFEQFSQVPGVCPGGMLAARIDSHIIVEVVLIIVLVVLVVVILSSSSSSQ